MSHPQSIKQAVEGLRNLSGPPPSQAGELTEPAQPKAQGGMTRQTVTFSAPWIRQDTNDNHIKAATGLSTGAPGISPVEGGDLRDAEENSELTSGKAMVCPVADDSGDPDWIPAHMRKKAKPTVRTTRRLVKFRY